MSHDDGNNTSLLKQLTPLIIGVVFRLVADFILSLFKRPKVVEKPPTKDEPDKPGC